MGSEVGGGFQREGTCVYLWLIRVVEWQKPTQYCRSIIPQLKLKNKLKMEMTNTPSVSKDSWL